MRQNAISISWIFICIFDVGCGNYYEQLINTKSSVESSSDSSLISVAKNSDAQDNLEEPILEPPTLDRRPIFPDIGPLYPATMLYPGLNIPLRLGSGGPNHRCGNGIREHVEQCDEGNETANCDDDCTVIECGDGNTNEAAGEECDNGIDNNNTEPDACRMNCKNSSCGDGVIDTGEECDNNDTNSGDGCSMDCKLESLFSVSARDNKLRVINPLTGATLCQRTLSLTGFPIAGATGLATDPATGILWGLLRTDSSLTRQLVTIDPVTAIATNIGPLGLPGPEGFTGLAFDASGRLFGVIGNGGTPSETLFTLNTSNGVATFFMALPTREEGGDSIAFNPIDGLLYHASGRIGNCEDNGVCFQSINLNTQTLTSIDITGTLLTSEVVQALTFWKNKGVFLWKQETITGPLYRVTPSGQVTLIGNVDHNARGLAFAFIANPCP